MQIKTENWLKALFAILLSTLLGMIGWFVRGSYVEQKEFNSVMNQRVAQLETYRASTEQSVLKSLDFIAAKSTIDLQLASHSSRIARLEEVSRQVNDTLSGMNRTLNNIDRKLGTR